MENGLGRVEMTIYLVGAGPGDPGLLTLRAAELLRSAEVVLYDRLVTTPILDMAHPDAKRVYVGRAVGDDTTHQESTNDMMLRYGRICDRVVRLKGGDPTIFGRGGEEARFLRAHDIPYQIVPGITSGIGSAAYSGIPLTYRGYSSSVAFVTGHEDPTKGNEAVDWKRLACSVDTIVIMMGLSRIRMICNGLLQGGMSPDTPVAVVHNGTTPHHSILTGTISDIGTLVHDAGMKPPANIIVGRVAALGEELGWR